MSPSEFPDPFKKPRKNSGTMPIIDQGEEVEMVLRMDDLKASAKNWSTFGSGNGVPGRIVVPSEVGIRDVRQIPVEIDPPLHSDYREILDSWFKRPLQSDYQSRLNRIISELLENVLNTRIEVVHDFALKLQSQALTLLLNVPIEESEEYLKWGTHVFRSDDSPLDKNKASNVDQYIHEQIDRVNSNPGDDLFSVLTNETVGGRKLRRKEIHGIMNLTFAGGRDTVINSVTNALAYFASHTDQIAFLRENPRNIPLAVEELIRYFSPLTHLGRITSHETEICGHALKKDAKVSLCWASANRDESVFDDPNQVKLDRRKNPHVGFGFGIHSCLGATHARQILKVLIQNICDSVSTIDLLEHVDNIEKHGDIVRKVGFHQLIVKMNAA